MGHVWCDGYVWDMSGVRYANNLLKNPATKRLSGKTRQVKVNHYNYIQYNYDEVIHFQHG